MPMQKNQIVQAALDVLDRDGLEGVTLRRLATELNVKAASIYYHIPSKERLLDEMANAILEEQFGTFDFENDQRDWAEWLHKVAHELRRAMLRHREGARVVAGAHPDIAVVLVKLWDFTIRVLHKGGFSLGKAGVITITMINFTFGSVIEEQASPPYAPGPPDAAQEIQSMGQRFQRVAIAMEAWMGGDSGAPFDTGVRIIINGVRAELAAETTDAK
ncbi:MAG: TetR/AcrR family transcriptional regulator C-terminal domain-containing protein [Chloroflexota bacterium]